MEAKNCLKTDKYNRTIINEDQAIQILLEGNFVDNAIFENTEDIRKYNDCSAQVLHCESLKLEDSLDMSVDDFHKSNIDYWDIPQEYKDVNILDLLVKKCINDAQLERVATEYIMFEERNMIPLLKFLLFFVEYCREHKYIWGVGRGSSVSSYCLFLLGVHKVDSLKFSLDIEEFLK